MTERLSTDVLIIGGGINGTGIAADAAGRGLNVVLCEQHDLASATSSASSKLIHGGLRYLEHGEFSLVRKALRERERLLNIAPHLIQPLQFIIPHNQRMRPRLVIRLGLFLYGRLGGKSQLPKPTQHHLKDNSVSNGLHSDCKIGFSYYDGWVDDSRLVISNALAAKHHGASILPHTKFISAEQHADYWHVTLQKSTGESLHYQTRALVNATGPWVNELQQTLGCQFTSAIRMVKGSHIIVPKLYEGDHAYLLQNSDDRIIFVIPYQQHFSLIGTTEENYKGDPSQASISNDEIAYLCRCVNHYFIRSLMPSDVISSYSGVRPLQHEPETAMTKVTRDYTIELDASSHKAPIMTIYGGKITTYRLLAAQAVKLLKPFFPKAGSSWTKKTTLPGGDLAGNRYQPFVTLLKHQYHWLDENIIARYAHSYGSRTHMLLQNCHAVADLGIHFGSGLYQHEVEYLIEHEWATNSDDILWRRSKLGLHLLPSQIENLKDFLENQ